MRIKCKFIQLIHPPACIGCRKAVIGVKSSIHAKVVWRLQNRDAGMVMRWVHWKFCLLITSGRNVWLEADIGCNDFVKLKVFGGRVGGKLLAVYVDR